MGMTLNEYLAEVDRWKQVVSDRTAAVSPEARAEMDREAIAWLEAKIGRKLPSAPRTERREQQSS
jgi:hypothetical protein